MRLKPRSVTEKSLVLRKLLQWSILGMHPRQRDSNLPTCPEKMCDTLIRHMYLCICVVNAHRIKHNGNEAGSASVLGVIENVQATLNSRSFCVAACAALRAARYRILSHPPDRLHLQLDSLIRPRL